MEKKHMIYDSKKETRIYFITKVKVHSTKTQKKQLLRLLVTPLGTGTS
jgi:hypothetical protein